MKTYSQQMKKKPFDWNKFLDRAIKYGVEFDDYEKALTLSEYWVTCACGNQCSIIPRDKETGSPLDDKLYSLGLMFSEELYYENYKEAKKTLKMIEKRSAKLIEEIEKEARKKSKPD